MTFDADEIDRSNRAHIALILGVPPSVVDEMSVADIRDVFARYNANMEIYNELMKRQRGK